MFSKNDKISDRQLTAILLLTFLGTEMFFLPAYFGKTEGWLTLLVGALAAAAFLPFLTLLARKEPSFTAVEWFRSLFGRKVGNILIYGLLAKLLFDGAIELRVFSEVLRRIILPKTSLWILLVLLLLLYLYTAQRGLETQGRAAEILLPFVLLPFLLFLVGAAFSLNGNQVLSPALPAPLPKDGHIGKSFFATQPLFQAMNFLLFVPPFLANGRGSTKKVWYAGLFAAVTAVLLILLSFVAYGGESLSHKLFAPLQLMERVGRSGVFFARQDLFLVWFWMVSAFLFGSCSLFFGGVCCQRLFGRKEPKGGIFLCALLIFLIALLPETMESALALRRKLSPILGMFYFVLFPLLFLISSKKGGKRNAA